MSLTLDDYAHKDIDQMSSSQLFVYGTVVTHAALAVLREAEGRTMSQTKLVDELVTGALGPSEISFGLIIGINGGLLERFEVGPVRFIRMVDDE